MRLQEAVQSYLVCIIAEGLSGPAVRKFRYVLFSLMAFMGDKDMDVLAITDEHLRKYFAIIPGSEKKELRRHIIVLGTFDRWVWVQKYLHPPVIPIDRSLPKSRRSSHFPWRAAVRRKLPLAQ